MTSPLWSKRVSLILLVSCVRMQVARGKSNEKGCKCHLCIVPDRNVDGGGGACGGPELHPVGRDGWKDEGKSGPVCGDGVASAAVRASRTPAPPPLRDVNLTSISRKWLWANAAALRAT